MNSVRIIIKKGACLINIYILIEKGVTFGNLVTRTLSNGSWYVVNPSVDIL